MSSFTVVGLNGPQSWAWTNLGSYLYVHHDISKYLITADKVGHRGSNLISVCNGIRAGKYTAPVIVAATTFEGLQDEQGVKLTTPVKVAAEILKLVAASQHRCLGCYLVGDAYWAGRQRARKYSCDPRTPMASKLYIINSRGVDLIKRMTDDQFDRLKKMLYGVQTYEDLALSAILAITETDAVYRNNEYFCLKLSSSPSLSITRARDIKQIVVNCHRDWKALGFADRIWTYARYDPEVCRATKHYVNDKFGRT